MYPDQHNYLIHWLKKGEKAKYVDKIKLANGRWRYFYSQAELEAYKLKQRLAGKANELKNKAYDNLGGKEKDEFMREWNRGNELYLQGKDEAANEAYDKAIAARDRYWKTPIGATLHTATTVKESVDDFLYDTGLSEKAPQYIAKAKKLLHGISEGVKDVGARAVVGVAKANDAVGRKLGREYQIAAWQTQKKANKAQQESRRLRALSDSSSAKAASARRHGASDEYVRIRRTDAKGFRRASEREASEASNYRTMASKAQRNYDNSILGKAEARVRAADLRKAQAKRAKATKKPATRTPEGQKVGSIFRDAQGDLDRLKREQEARKKSRSSSVFKNGRDELERQKAMRSKSDRPQSRKKHVTSGGTGVHKRRRIDYSRFER